MGLPDFAKPPVNEVALGVQFDPLTTIRNAQICAIWAEMFRNEYPLSEEVVPLDPVEERFGAPGPKALRLQLHVGLPVPRYWFKNEDETELVQIQRDRFIRNWRRLRTKEAYPRFDTLRDRMIGQFIQFCDHVGRSGMGVVKPNQVEVTYINDLPAGQGWESFGELGKAVTVWRGEFSDGFLPQAEEARVAMSFVIPGDGGRPAGRLHVSVEPVYRLPDVHRVLRLSLTARGAPIGEGVDGVKAFMEVGHAWVVKGFASVTTQDMHRVWERTDDR